MTLWSPLLTKLLRRKSNMQTKEVSPRFIEDALITQMQPIFNQEITDIHITGLGDPVQVTVWLKKGGNKTEKL